VKPLTMTDERLAAIRFVLGREPEHVQKSAKGLLAEVDALRAALAAAEAKLADERKHADALAREIDLGPCPCCASMCGTPHDSECTYEKDAPVQAKLWRCASEALAAHAARRNAENAVEREEGKR